MDEICDRGFTHALYLRNQPQKKDTPTLDSKHCMNEFFLPLTPCVKTYTSATLIVFT